MKTDVKERLFFPERFRQRNVRFAEIANDALEYSRSNKSPNSYKIDRWKMGTILTWFRERVAEEITPQDIERRLRELSEEGKKPATINRYRALLSLVYSVANRNGKLSVNPARLVRLRVENNARDRHLDEQEEDALRAAILARFPDRCLEFELALHTGMRRGEQYRLRWQDVDLKLGIITVPKSKHGKKRHIPINSVARTALESLLKKRDNSGYVIPGSCTLRAKDGRRWFEEIVQVTGISNFRWHDLRHTFASRLVMVGVDIRTVQELMGHKTIAMTVRYSHLAPAHQLQAVERLTAKTTSTAISTRNSGNNLAGSIEIPELQSDVGAGGGT